MILLLLACSAEAPADMPPAPQPPPPAPPEAPAPLVCPDTTADLAARYPDLLDPGDPRLASSDLVVVRKAARRVMLFDGGQRVPSACWSMGLGFAPEGHKMVEGDGKTPEGFYATSDKPWSQFYGAIAVHYPNTEDAEAAVTDGRISAATARGIAARTRTGAKPDQYTGMGGEILIHGGGGSSDWTLGCVAMDNTDLDLLRAALPRGMKTTVLILP